MSDDFSFPSLCGVFGLTSNSAQRRARWMTPEGRAVLDEALRIAREGGAWQSALADLPYVGETFDGEDFSISQRDLRSAPLDGLDLAGANLRGAMLHEASLKAAKLNGADVRGARVSDTAFLRSQA